MKKLLIMVIGMTTLYLQGSYFGYGNLPEFYRKLETGMENLREASVSVSIIAQVDCRNLASEGEKESLEWVRKYLERYPPEAVEAATRDDRTGLGSIESGRASALEYLAVKGDGRYIGIVSQYASDALASLLKMRVAGINVFDYDAVPGLGKPKFFPSVMNTGPQAVYVREILYRCWEEAGRDSSKIPQELLTMTVSFGEDNNPICSVDLAKYGLSMPIITPRPHRNRFNYWNEGTPWDKPAKMTVEFPDLTEPVETTPYMDRKSPDWKGLYVHVKKNTPPPNDEQPPANVTTASLTDNAPPLRDTSTAETPYATEQSPPPSRPWLYVGILALLCAGGVFWLIRKKR